MWTALGSSPDHTVGITPYALDDKAIKTHSRASQNGQVSPSDICGRLGRDASIPVDQLRNEPLWSKPQLNGSHQFHDDQKQITASIPRLKAQQEASIQSSVSRPAPQPSIEVNENQHPVTKSEPQKRRRGRPRLQSPSLDFHGSSTSSVGVSFARTSHLEKNRVAAEKCRQRKKEYVATLTANASVLSSKNKALKTKESNLREQLLTLKNELLRHAGCGSWAIDKYIEQSAGGQLGMKVPTKQIPARKDSAHAQQSNITMGLTKEHSPEPIMDPLPSQESSDLSIDLDELDDLWLLKDYLNVEE
ncbi:hypothetical protein ACN47E_007303 [Coniothyrium glycines]